MATLYVTEFADISATQGVLIGKQPPVAEQTVAIGASSAQSSAFNQRTNYIRLSPDTQICSVLIGSNPTAAATNMRMAAGSVEYFAVPQGAKVAVILNT